VDNLRRRFPARFENPSPHLERDYLRVVEQHLDDLLPLVLPHVGKSVRSVFDFGCGPGGSAIALAMVYPQVRCCGMDIDAGAIEVARERAELYGVADRCEFTAIQPNERLPIVDESFDLCLCSSVIEYVTEREARRFCIQEMVRAVRPNGLLFFSVPNGLYPFEVHTGMELLPEAAGRAHRGFNVLGGAPPSAPGRVAPAPDAARSILEAMVELLRREGGAGLA
jgi:SAM-dependent methyltransferase